MIDNPNLTDEYVDYFLHNKILSMSYITNGCNEDCADRWKELERVCHCDYERINQIGKNLNLSLEYKIEKYNDSENIMFHNFDYILNHKDFTIEFIEENPDFIDWRLNDEDINLSLNPNITLEFIKKYKNRKWWNKDDLIKNPNIQVNDIIDNPDLPWGPKAKWWNNPNVKPEHLIKYNHIEQFKWIIVSQCFHTSMEYIFSHLEYPWHWEAVSMNPNLTIEYIKNNKHINWSYCFISSNLMTYHPDVYRRNISNYIYDYKYIIQNLSGLITQFV